MLVFHPRHPLYVVALSDAPYAVGQRTNALLRMRFLQALGSTVLWTVIAIVIVAVVFEILDKRYRLMDEIFKENSIAAAILAGSFVIGIFYTVAQIVIH